MHLDEVLLLLGAWGRYQVLVYFAISLFDNFPSIWHMSIMAFLGYEPEHHCKVPYGSDPNCTLPVTYEEKVPKIDKCSMHTYLNRTCSNETVACQEGWWYNPDPVEISVVTEWGLVCDRNVLPEMSQMVFNLGVMFGALLFGFLSDKFGRKKPFVIALLVQTVIGSLVAASPNFYVFMALRFFVGALEQGINITGFVMATELFPPKQRTIAAVTHEFFWAIGGAVLPILAYFLRQWRHLQLACSLPSVFAISLFWLIPESVVWLHSKGRLKEAEAILERMAVVNKRPLPAGCLRDHETKPMLDGGSPTAERAAHCYDNHTYTILDLFKTPRLRKISLCICTLWALNTMVYYGLSYNTPNLEGDMYLNFFIGQMVEIPSVAVTMLLIYKVGRRWPLFLFHVFGGIVCIASPFIPLKTAAGFDLSWLAVTLAMLGKFAINASFTIIYMYGPEIYPTVLRNTGAGLGSFAGRFGGILYPYINYLSKLDTPLNKQLPLIVFGALSIVGGFAALPLPETRHQPLPETVDDVEHYEEFCKREAHQANGHASYEMAPVSEDKAREANV